MIVEPYETVEGTNHSGSVINLFDYWLDEGEDGRSAADNHWGNTNGSDNPNLTKGINKDHALKFRLYYYVDDNDINTWTESASPHQNIVANTLQGGYPYLTQESANSVKGISNDSYSAESLAYLFDPTIENLYKETFKNVKGLLQIDDDGYYYYNSQQNFAELDETNNKINLYEAAGVTTAGGGTGQTPPGQFFPFNDFDEVRTLESIDEPLNHYFGMTLTTRFVQKYGGHTKIDEEDPMTFEFAGDDDVWIFIDDVLVADLGGVHNRTSVKIDFSTGKVTINDGNDGLNTTIHQQYVNAGKANTVNWTQNGDNTIFEDGSCHTLKFFYLERGNTDSNLDLKYNLGTYPATDISKVDQYGNGVKDATFDVYAANENYEITSAESLYTGTTDENGKMTFVDEYGMPYTIAELEQMFGTHFVLKETAPAGYRQVGSQINLEVIGHKLLACNNPQESGAQASATLQIEAPNALIPVSGSLADAKSYYDYDDPTPNLNGTLFAVVLRYIGPRDAEGNATGLNNQNNWAPVYGTQKDGFTVVDVSKYNNDFIGSCHRYGSEVCGKRQCVPLR